MTKITGEYEGSLKCTMEHEPSGAVIYTDAPADIGGGAESFSPTDLVGAALGGCIATTLGMYGKRKGWDFKGMRFSVVKEMMQGPERRIGALRVEVWMPVDLSHEDRVACERVALSCPVHKSLHPGIEADVKFFWPQPG